MINQHHRATRIAPALAALLIALPGLAFAADDDLSLRADDAAVQATLRASFTGNDMAPLTRLDQTEEQKACTAAAGKPLDPALRTRLQKAAMDSIQYPADGQYLGDWQRGQQLAVRGNGLTWRDKPGSQAYGNCYACHQLETAELSFGTIGPSLNNYGKIRGNSPAMLKYTWGRLWNSHAFNACNAMPRFGAAGILSEADLKDLMALLHDPASPVNE